MHVQVVHHRLKLVEQPDDLCMGREAPLRAPCRRPPEMMGGVKERIWRDLTGVRFRGRALSLLSRLRGPAGAVPSARRQVSGSGHLT